MTTLKTSIFVVTILLLLMTTACGINFQLTPTLQSTDQVILPISNSEPTTIPDANRNIHTACCYPAFFLVFPYISADAGNFALLAGETITFTWENAPTGADRYEFVLALLNKEPSLDVGDRL